MAATKLRIYNDVLRLLGDVRLATLTDDVEARYALDDAWSEGVEFVLRQAAWRFALLTAPLTVIPSLMPGYARGATLPAPCLRPHAIYISTVDGRECPFDFRENSTAIAFNVAVTPTIRFVSSIYADPLTGWPEHFAQTVAAYLAVLVAERVTGERAAASRMSQLFASLLPEAVKSDAMDEDFWLPYQRNGEFLRAARKVITGANFDFSLKTVQVDTQQVTPADVGWPYLFAKPADHLRTQGLWINFGGVQCPFDIRETKVGWSTATPVFVASYVSSDGLDSTVWPEAVTNAVSAYLEWEGEGAEEEEAKPQKEQLEGAEFQAAYKIALDQYGIPDHPWLRFQFNGSYIEAVHALLERGRWRFAVKTVSLANSSNPNSVSDGSTSPGYTNRLLKPNDWLRTLRLYKSFADGLVARWIDIDYRDELDAFHTNYAPCILRYVSRLGLDATRWPANFRDAVLAWLEHLEARSDPKMVAVAKAKFDLFEMASKEAQNVDDESDVPPVLSGGRFASARYGRGGFDRKQGWPPF